MHDEDSDGTLEVLFISPPLSQRNVWTSSEVVSLRRSHLRVLVWRRDDEGAGAKRFATAIRLNRKPQNL